MKKVLFFIVTFLVCNFVYALEPLEQPLIVSNCDDDYCEVHINFDERTEELTIFVNDELVAEFTSEGQSQSGFNVVSWGSIVATFPLTDEFRIMNLEVQCDAEYYESSAYTYEVEIPAMQVPMSTISAPELTYTYDDDFVTVTMAPSSYETEKIFYRIIYGDNTTDWMEYDNNPLVFERPYSTEEGINIVIEAYATATGFLDSPPAVIQFILVPRNSTGPGDDPIIDPVVPGTDPVDPIPDPSNPSDPVDTNSNTLEEKTSNNVKNPLTGDNVIIAFMGLLISMVSIIILNRIKKKISV